MLVISDRHKLIYRQVPKCASTSVTTFFLNLHGVPFQGNPRKHFAANQEELKIRYGLWSTRSDENDLEKIVDSHQDYCWFSVVRNPYGRVLSNYHNKLNRYSYAFDRGAYLRGKLAQLLCGPRAWGKANQAAECMKRYLPFDAFVEGLDQHGVQFDSHYYPQCELLSPEVISYQKLIRLEEFNQGINELLSSRSIECSEEFAASYRQQSNASNYKASPESLFTSRTREIVYRLYQRDFEFLEYPQVA